MKRVRHQRHYDFVFFVAFFSIVMLLVVQLNTTSRNFTGNVVSPGESIIARWNSDPRHPAPHAIDRDFGTYYMACLSHKPAPHYNSGYVIYALSKSPREFQNVSLLFARAPVAPEPAGYPCDYTLSVSNNRTHWVNVYSHEGCDIKTRGDITIQLDAPIKARYLNLTYLSMNIEDNCIALRDFRVA